MDYLGKNGVWHNESTLKEFNKLGEVNPNFNAQAAADTHMSKPSVCP
ncbi:hypothetical protein I2486_18320 [Cellulophaga sp. E16_2]|nr:hypothetical protein [Cellulophaga sp. E16_2]MBO0593362.1 hypothetical protein [Cellulophaga sp. E16_2]